MASRPLHPVLDDETGTESAVDFEETAHIKKYRYSVVATVSFIAMCVVGLAAFHRGNPLQHNVAPMEDTDIAQRDRIEMEAERQASLKEEGTDLEAMKNDIPIKGLMSAAMCQKEVGCDLKLSKVSNSNLGGKDKSNPTNLIYANVCTYNGKKIDMIVTASQPYTGKESKNGMLGKFGILSMAAGTKTNFTFTFVDSSTGAPKTISSLRWSVLDFDCHTLGCDTQSEKVTFKGYSSYKMGAGAQMKEINVDGGVTIVSTEKGGGDDNPKDPAKLTALQERRQVTLEYKNVQSFLVTYELAGSQKTGFRNFIFSPEASVKDKVPVPCPTPPPTKALPTPAPTKNNIFPPVPEKAMIFVVDVSWSMSCSGGWWCLIGKMKTEFKNQIDSLQGYQYFGIVSFSQQAWLWKTEMSKVNAANIKSAKAWIDTLQPVSGTYYHVALAAAYAMATPPGVKLDAIYFLSDGHPNDCYTSSYDDCFKSKFAIKPDVKVKTILLHNSASAKKYLKAMSSVTGGVYYEAFI